MKKVFLVFSLLMSLSIHSGSKSVPYRSNPIVRAMSSSAALILGAIAAFNQNAEATNLPGTTSCLGESTFNTYTGTISCKGDLEANAYVGMRLQCKGESKFHPDGSWECSEGTTTISNNVVKTTCFGGCTYEQSNVYCKGHYVSNHYNNNRIED